MSIDSMIGKAKELAGKALNDKELQAEGIVEQSVTKAKEEANHMADKLKDGVDDIAKSISDKAKGLLGDAKEKTAEAVIDAKEKLDSDI